MHRCCTGGHCPSFFHHPILLSSSAHPPLLFLPPLPSQKSDHPSTLSHPHPPSVALFCPRVSVPGPGWLMEPDIKVKSLHPSYPSSLCLSFFSLPPLDLHFLRPVAALRFLSGVSSQMYFFFLPRFLLLFLSSVRQGWKCAFLCSVIFSISS